jgi:phosphatidylinositol phospholipase C, delta
VQQADVQSRDFLDFDDFKRFVKLLKARPEVKRLYKRLCLLGEGGFSFQTFERFMRNHQKVSKRVIWLSRNVSYNQSSRMQAWTN